MESSIPDDVSPEVASRWHQMFPVLTESEIARIGRFGTVRRYARGDRLFGAGEPGPGMFVVLKGVVAMSQRIAAALTELLKERLALLIAGPRLCRIAQALRQTSQVVERSGDTGAMLQ